MQPNPCFEAPPHSRTPHVLQPDLATWWPHPGFEHTPALCTPTGRASPPAAAPPCPLPPLDSRPPLPRSPEESPTEKNVIHDRAAAAAPRAQWCPRAVPSSCPFAASMMMVVSALVVPAERTEELEFGTGAELWGMLPRRRGRRLSLGEGGRQPLHWRSRLHRRLRRRPSMGCVELPCSRLRPSHRALAAQWRPPEAAPDPDEPKAVAAPPPLEKGALAVAPPLPPPLAAGPGAAALEPNKSQSRKTVGKNNVWPLTLTKLIAGMDGMTSPSVASSCGGRCVTLLLLPWRVPLPLAPSASPLLSSLADASAATSIVGSS